MTHPIPPPIERTFAAKQWWRDRLAKFVVLIWGAICLVGVATLMVGHSYALPRPETHDATLGAALAGLRPAEFEGWQMVHFLYVKCGCSRRIVDHLMEGGRPSSVHETIVLVGEDPVLRDGALASGFNVVVVTPGELTARFGVTGTPAFAVTDPDNVVQYLGGYTDRKQGTTIRDVEIVQRLQSGGVERELPLFGCATSAELQAILDPLGLKY